MKPHFTKDGNFIYYHYAFKDRTSTYFVPRFIRNKAGNISRCNIILEECNQHNYYITGTYRKKQECKYYECNECVLGTHNLEVFKRFKRIKELEEINE